MDYEAGQVVSVQLHDGAHLNLKKLETDYDPTNKREAVRLAHEAREKEQLLTGLLYYNADTPDFNTLSNLPEEPIYAMNAEQLRPSREAFGKVMQSLMG